MQIKDLYYTSQTIGERKLNDLKKGIEKANDSLTHSNRDSFYTDVVELSSEKKKISYKQENLDNNILKIKQKKMIVQIDQVRQVTEELQSIVVKFNGGNSQKKEQFDIELRSCLDKIQRVLNSKETGISTLSGKAITVDSVCDLLDLPTLEHDGILQFDYYKGSDGYMPVSINDDVAVDLYSITANHPAFAKVIQAVRLCLAYTPGDSGKLGQAIEFCKSAIAIDFPEALQTVRVELNKLENALAELPMKQMEEEALQENINGEDTMQGLINLQTLQSALRITEYLMMQEMQQLRDFVDKIAN
jgi:hypothetical protein